MVGHSSHIAWKMVTNDDSDENQGLQGEQQTEQKLSKAEKVPFTCIMNVLTNCLLKTSYGPGPSDLNTVSFRSPRYGFLISCKEI